LQKDFVLLVELSKDTIAIRMAPSNIVLFDKNWEFNKQNKILLQDGRIQILDFELLEDDGEKIGVFGILADSTPTNITIRTEQLNVNKVNLFSETEISGEMDSRISIFRSDAKNNFKFDGEFYLSELIYKNILVGDLFGQSQWLEDNQSVYSRVEVSRENFNRINVEGEYFPNNDTSQLDLIVDFQKADLGIGQPFVEENLSDLRGFADGKVFIVGTLKKPYVVGDVNVDAFFTLDYLNTDYEVAGEIKFDKRAIMLNGLNLVDRKGSKAQLQGVINHRNYENFNTDIRLIANNFEFLNTSQIDNSLYYGSAYGTGEISVAGPFNDLVIDATVQTERNTRFFIPVTESSNIEQESFITFINFSDTTTTEEDENLITGMTLNFNIEVTPDAYCELIFDIKTGDIIKGRGNGNLRLNINTDGEFSMFGPLTITQGSYNFTMANFINKAFNVTPGSRITWYGDPYNAILDLEANYLQRASFSSYVNVPEGDQQPNTAANDRVPLNVVLNLEGEMSAPTIGFDIRFVSEAEASDEEKALLNEIRTNEQELRRQFISLIFLKRFSPRESFALGSGGNLGNSFSEFVSNQMSYLISQLDENLEVEVDLASLDNEAFNTLQLRLAYTFLNGRLKVTRGGDFGSTQEDTRALENIVGDWSLEYSLTEDGKFRIKVFQNTNNLSNTTSQGIAQAQETGVSLKFVYSFNNFIEMLKSARREAQENSRSSTIP
jgi:hypothetical protein